MITSNYKVYSYRWTIQIMWICFTPITSPAASFYGVSDLRIGLLAMIFMIIYVPISIPVSWVIDTLGYRKSVSIGVAIMALSMLKRRGLITDRVIKLISNWRHSGFNVYCGDRIYPKDAKSMENISRYIIRVSFSTERLNYIKESSRVIYKSKTRNDTKEFDALDFIASITSHIPNRNEQTLRYLGYYSNVCRGKRKKKAICQSDYVIEDDSYNKSCSKS